MIKSEENLIGAWAFTIGVIVAIIIGFFQAQLGTYVNWIYLVLIGLGTLVGLMNLADKDLDKFLIASVSIVIVGYMGQEALKVASRVGLTISIILAALLVMFIPATIIVALKAVFSISKS